MTIKLAPGRALAASTIAIRPIEARDLAPIERFPFTVSITEPLDDAAALRLAFEQSGFWTPQAGAVAIVDRGDGRLLGTAQYYRAAPCIHGFELGYIIHRPEDRGRGAASEAVGLLVDHLFATTSEVHRLQLIIEAWNVASWKLAERCAFVREGLLRGAGFGADPADCYIYARTRRDWREAQQRSVSMGGTASDGPWS
jgi:RimJ/RimL family protein N-acetyltransferase